MRIGIDYTSAVWQGAGIGRYTRNLIRAVTQFDADSDYRLLIAGGWGRGDGLGLWTPNVRLCPMPLSDRWTSILWQRLRLPVPVQTVTGRLDLFHSPDFVLPPTWRTPAIVTIHDLSFLRVPQYFVPAFCRYLGAAVRRAVRRAQCVLADSESTRRDLAELLAVEEDRITVICPGVEERFRPVDEQRTLERVRERYGLPACFVLGLGTLQPRKNFRGLIQAFGELLKCSDHRVDLESLHLVIAGGKGWLYGDLADLVGGLGLSERIHFPGFVEDDDLPALYSLAQLLVFPSWYEGFGLPVLEAMACGTPVVAADNSSLPEVAGQAALLIDPADTQALAYAMERALKDSALQERMILAGRQQASRFTWQQSAEQLSQLYKRCLKSAV